MVGFIQQNYSEKVSLKDIAAAGAVGQSKCCKLFSSYLNQTPNEYLTLYRLNKGCELLSNTDRTIAETALEVGFSSASYFAETFRKAFGQSPTEYRRGGLLFTPQPKSGCAVKSNGIRPIGSSPLAKGRMHGKPHSLAQTKQRVLGLGVKSNGGGNYNILISEID